MRFYAISAALEAELANATNPETGEIAPETALRISAIEQERDEKALDIACVVKDLKAEQDAYETEIARLEANAKALAKRIDWLRGYLDQFLPEGAALKAVRASIRFGESESIEITDEAQVPENYRAWSYTIPKTPIKDAFKAGTMVPGARLVKKRFVVIK